MHDPSFAPLNQGDSVALRAESADCGGPATVPIPPPKYNREMTRQALEALHGESECFEIRIIDCEIDRQRFIVKWTNEAWKKTVSGFFDNIDDAVVELQRVKGVSCYVTVNPIDPAFMATDNSNKLGVSKTTTKDDDVVHIRHLYVDADVERKPQTSSTEAELKEAIALRDEVLDSHLGARDSAHYGQSGNGAWACIYLGNLPNDEHHRKLIADATEILNKRASRPKVKIDLKTKNPSRVMCLGGTVKHKGTSRPDRPHRLATIDSSPGPREPFALAAWVDQHRDELTPEATAAAPVNKPDRKRATGKGGADKITRFLAYMAKMDPAKSGNDGHGRTFNVCCEANRFGLSHAETFAVVRDHYNHLCDPPWTDKELNHKIDDAQKNVDEAGTKEDRPIGSSGTVYVGSRQAEDGTEIKVSIDDRIAEIVELDSLAELMRDEALMGSIAYLPTTEVIAITETLKKISGFSATKLDKALKDIRKRDRKAKLKDDAGADGIISEKMGSNLYSLIPDRGFSVMTNMQGDMPTDYTEILSVSNFTATITDEITRDSGVEQTRRYGIKGRLWTGQSLSAEIGAEQFASMDWVGPNFGSRAIISADRGAKEHTRVAVQLFSDPAQKTIYTHTGWRKIGKEWVYLHSGGAITERGLNESVGVDLGDTLAGFRFPAPPDGDQLRKAVRSTFRILMLGSDDRPRSRGVASLAAGYPWRAVQGQTRYSLQFTGPTGTHKSCLAALIQQHFAPACGFANLPAGWNSTSNALGSWLHTLADSVLVVDDFVPGKSPRERERIEKQADEILRAQGNRQGRQRMGPDGKLRPAMNPRGSMVMTGEDRPGKASANNRTLSAWFERGEADGADATIDKAILSKCQADADSGLYAQAMAAYIQYLAPKYEETQAELTVRAAEFKPLASKPGGHPRTSDDVADLAAAFSLFLDFAKEVGAIDEGEAGRFQAMFWEGLMEIADTMSDEFTVDQLDPSELFLDALRSALQSGQAYITDLASDTPDGREAACGWRQTYKYDGSDQGQILFWEAGPNAKRIGFIHGGYVYLDPTVSYSVATAMRRDHADGLPSQRMLNQLLHASKKIAKIDTRQTKSGNPRLTTRVKLKGGMTISALCVWASALWPDSDQSADSADEEVASLVV